MAKNEPNPIDTTVGKVGKFLERTLSEYLGKEPEEFNTFKTALSAHLRAALATRPPQTRWNHLVGTREEDLKNPNVLVLYGLDFSGKTLERTEFNDKILIHCSFREGKFNDCRFRHTSFYFCDLRYANFNSGTFENAEIWWCDLYRAYFQGLIRFYKALIADTSLNNACFSGATLIRKMNFEDKRLLQDNSDTYRRFLSIWDTARSAEDSIKSDENLRGEAKIDHIVSLRHEERELVFKSLCSTFSANGFSNDSNWAYVEGKRAERKVLRHQAASLRVCSREIGKKLNLWRMIVTNRLFDFAFGYGESLFKICRTYLFIVLLFTFLYMYKANVTDFTEALLISFKNMVGTSDKLEVGNNIFLSVLNLIQTTLGILLTGIFGFILGNKIRNQ